MVQQSCPVGAAYVLVLYQVVLISTLVSAAGVMLLLYCSYVSYYGSWGLPKKLQTVSPPDGMLYCPWQGTKH
jgi:hypothetical protein